MAVRQVTEAIELSEVKDLGNLSKPEVLTGAQILIKALEAEGVDTVFGYPGGAVLAIYDCLYESNIRHILTRHEQGAVHAADGYARATGKPGVCIATSGPGATNLVTGIANAYMDSVPLIAITGQVSLDMVGKDSFQEADITGITLPITKYGYLVKDVKDLARIVREAFYIATTGRPGPVIIDIPKDICTQKAEFMYPPEIDLPGYQLKPYRNGKQINRAAQAIMRAKKPVIYAGGGVIASGAHRELLELAEKLNIPVTITLMGKGSIPEDHPLCLGMLGMHGTCYANYAVSECDLLLAVGVRFDDRVTGRVDTFAPNATIIHIDIDPAEIGKNVPVDIPIVGDVKLALRDLLKLVEPRERRDWLDTIEEWRRRYPLHYEDDNNGRLKPQYVIEQIYEITRGDAYITTEVGQHQMWAAQYYRCRKPRSFISSGGLGTMGFGLPAAIGVQIAHPEATVFDIAGDGSVQMTSQELATIAQYNLPIKVAILNNQYLGMVRQWQELFFNKRYSQSEVLGPDFVKLAEAYGIEAVRVTKREEVRPALERALATKKPFLLDFWVEREENVFPMVPPGGSLNKMLGR
ncbi:biosynthetic-type acetolactate synthase large subunit [Calderihabitans maritimus]|uniref:biosynthetic-type acetolactate synthase large subunit n=1 Tax=Calderihabitans maritimus TaxID=1246530 RepID=UPI000B509BF6|nr:biosynthetic-type acetolactate synthase large subunit [Calderihabitans maritimus]